MILHADLNSFFARVEQQDNPAWRNRPIGVLGKSSTKTSTCVCAASPEAKHFGIYSGISTTEARRLCPTIKLVPPHYDRYLEISRAFIKIIEMHTPWIEIFSIDEAFFTLESPHKIQAWDNDRLAHAEQVARQIKYSLQKEVGELITCSIGIAWGKAFAKLASDLQKPNGLISLAPETWRNNFGDLPVQEICGIGRQLTQRLAKLRITTISHLAQADKGMLFATFGRHTGRFLSELSHGIDRTPIQLYQRQSPPKTIGHQITLPYNTPPDKLETYITRLVIRAARRLRQSAQGASKLELTLSSYANQMTKLHTRLPAQTHDDITLIRNALELARQYTTPKHVRIRRVHVILHELQPLTQKMLPLFPEQEKWLRLTNKLDKIRNQFGSTSIEWGSGFGATDEQLRDWRGSRAVLNQ